MEKKRKFLKASFSHASIMSATDIFSDKLETRMKTGKEKCVYGFFAAFFKRHE